MPAVNNDIYCVWDSPSEPVSILLNLRLVDSIRQWIDETDPQLQEVGGVLLGRLERAQDKTVIMLESFRPAHISHRRGPGFTLTEGEQVRLCKKFAQPAKNGLMPVGFMRTNLRNYLQPDVPDTRLLNTASPESIFLLVRPGEWIAGLFHASGESLGPRFPFDTDSLQQCGMPMFQAPGAQPGTKRRPFPQWAAPLASCLLLMLAAAAYFWPKSQPAPAAKGFGLAVQHVGKALRLTWNPQMLHGKAVLQVNDGEFHQSVSLDSRQVSQGTALYVPASTDVIFRIETPHSADSIRIAASAPPPTVATTEARQPVPAPRKAPVRHLVAGRLTPKPKAAPAPLSVAPARLSAAVQPAPLKLAPKPAPAQPLAPARLSAAVQPAPLKLAPDPERVVSVTYVSPPEANRHGIEKVPVLRMFKHPHALEPARPVAAIQPKVPRSLVPRAETQVEVKATVDKNGRVSKVEPLWSQGDERLMRLVTEAVRRASFYPARSNGHDVSSKLVLTFHFGANATAIAIAPARASPSADR